MGRQHRKISSGFQRSGRWLSTFAQTPRPRLVVAATCLLLSVGAAVSSEVNWVDGKTLSVSGVGWPQDTSGWGRLPDSAQENVRAAVWNLSRETAGIALHFTTDAPSLEVKWTLTSDRLAMEHMPATGVSGLDLYVQTSDGWLWATCPRPKAKANSATLLRGLAVEPREFMLMLPLYNGIESIQIGVPAPFTVEPTMAKSQQKPIVFYGTSITQGACASRPGRTHAAILGRRLDRPVLNLGFSGNGRLELALADLLGELDAAVYVIDCLPNLNGKLVAERTVPFIERLRSLRPDTPILLVEDRTYGDAWIKSERAERNRSNRAAFRAAWAALRQAGVKGIAYLEGDALLGSPSQATTLTVDGSHPTDLGFVAQADAMEPLLRTLLSQTPG